MPSAPIEKDSNRPTNLAARMARWSAHHRKKAIFGWLAFDVRGVCDRELALHAEGDGLGDLRAGGVRTGGHDSLRGLQATGR